MAATKNLDYFTTFLEAMEKGKKAAANPGDAILQALKGGPRSVGHLLKLTAAATAISSTDFADYLSKLESIGLVRKSTQGSSVVYELTEDGKEAVAGS
jgi:predicted transcriptional regulator